jgi:1-acyl-sn-glycerol-3-phosphate acyltransferase
LVGPQSLRTPFALRIARAARVFAHVLQGIATTKLVFPRVGIERRRALIRRWSRELLAMLRVEAFVDGMPVEGLPDNLLIVANHVSWLDVFVLHSLRPSRFIGKSELKRWPLLRHLIIGSGTLFLERDRRRDALRINGQARDALASGDTIAIFPEGTTSDGTQLLRFHASLVQPVIDAQGHVQPIAIRYRGAEGGYTDAPVYIGETNFVESLWRVLGERRFVVEVTLGPTLSARARHRRELSREAEAFIRAAVEAPARDPAPGTRDRRRLASR